MRDLLQSMPAAFCSGGQLLVQPDGTVVVPFLAHPGAIRSFTSTGGGAA